MHEGFVTALLWLGFAGTHIGLTTRLARARLVCALGERGFIVLYSMVALVTFGVLVHYVALHRVADSQASLLTSIPPVHGALFALSVFGFSLFVAGVLVYPQLPMAAFRHRVMKPRGIQQVTRHPFFSGISLWAIAHALLATSSVALVFFMGIVVLGFGGGLHQDRRLTSELGEDYRSYVASTSFWPFVAVATKRQRINWREQPWFGYITGIAASLGLYQVHPHIFDHGGAYVIVAVSAGSLISLANTGVRSARPTKG
jgi:uncharacterized membrane protein